MPASSGRLATVAPEAGLLLGAGRAILLQLANPQVGRAVAEHSDFANSPLSRLLHTLGYVYALSNGTPAQRRKIIAYVDRAHAPVHAPRNKATGEPAYSALDPKLQLWVAATLYDSARTIGAQVLPWWSEMAGEELYAEYSVLGGALQMTESWWPSDEAAFDRYFDEQLSSLEVSEVVRQLAQDLFEGANAPWWIRLALPLMQDVTIAQLPEAARAQFGYQLTAQIRRRNDMVIFIARAASRMLPRWVRHLPVRVFLRHVDRLAEG